ncbi:MAG: ABC transporter ATP-binding protein [Bacteroidota bacterium]
MSALSTLGLHKTYRSLFGAGVEALQPLDLTVERGEIFGLLGPNGAGKTTLVKLLLGIVRPSGGEGRLFGRDILSPEARQAVGFLPESHRFPPYLTAAQTLDHYARVAGVAETDRARRIPALLERVRMAKRADTRVRTFSKGMMQRLGLAQALMNSPDLVFLDEPTDGVDPVGRREIRDLLLEISAGGTTIFLNSHLLSEVEQVCTRVAILKHGALARIGSVDELTAQDRTYELRCTPLPGTLGPDLRALFSSAPATGTAESDLVRYRLGVQDRTALNAALDALRAASVEIESVQPLRQSLEDFFVEVVAPSAGAAETAPPEHSEDGG